MLSAASIFAKGLGASMRELDTPAPTARNPNTVWPWVWPWCRLQPTHIWEREAPPIIYSDGTLSASPLYSQQKRILT